MKYLVTIIIFSLFTVRSNAYLLEAMPVDELIADIKKSEFHHIEDGLSFGFNSILSCLYVSNNFAILKNYCVPKKDYPAKGFTIISMKFGIIDFYQEKMTDLIKTDIQISTFPDMLKDFIEFQLEKSNISNTNELFDILYELNGPACWSTNANYQTGKPLVACNSPEVVNFQAWSQETQEITSDTQKWDELFDTIESTLQK